MDEELLNTIWLGDCFELLKKIPDKSIDCIYVDIPYQYIQGGKGKSSLAKRKSSLNGELENSKITHGIDIKRFVEESFRVMKKCNMFVWCSQSQIRELCGYIYIYAEFTKRACLGKNKPYTMYKQFVFE